MSECAGPPAFAGRFVFPVAREGGWGSGIRAAENRGELAAEAIDARLERLIGGVTDHDVAGHPLDLPLELGTVELALRSAVGLQLAVEFAHDRFGDVVALGDFRKDVFGHVKLQGWPGRNLSLIHISEPTRLL